MMLLWREVGETRDGNEGSGRVRHEQERRSFCEEQEVRVRAHAPLAAPTESLPPNHGSQTGTGGGDAAAISVPNLSQCHHHHPHLPAASNTVAKVRGFSRCYNQLIASITSFFPVCSSNLSDLLFDRNAILASSITVVCIKRIPVNSLNMNRSFPLLGNSMEYFLSRPEARHACFHLIIRVNDSSSWGKREVVCLKRGEIYCDGKMKEQ